MRWHSDFGGKGKTAEDIDRDAKEVYEILKKSEHYEQDRPKLTERTIYLYNVFNALGRRRIEYRALQKNDILEELELSANPDIDLKIIERLDNYWLEQKAEELSKK